MTPPNKPTKPKKPARTSQRPSPAAEGPQPGSLEPSPAAQGAGTATTTTGFWLGLEHPRGTDEGGRALTERSLQDYLAGCGLRVGGRTERYIYIEAAVPDRELTLSDQVEVADWCLHETDALQIVVSSFTSVNRFPPMFLGVLRLRRSDLATLSVATLYRLGRINAAQYAEILRGFVQSYSDELLT